MAKSKRQKILDRAAEDKRFRDKLIQLGSLRDQFTYPSLAVWKRLGPAMLELAKEAGLLKQDETQESLDELINWLLENVDELAFFAKPIGKLIHGRRYQRPVGNVFLSWTVKSPRERNAVLGIKKALDYFNIEYFDYTQHQVDDFCDLSEQIVQQLNRAINKADITIEVYSCEIGSKWIQRERDLIKESGVALRIFACLETEIATHLTLKSSEEISVVRINMSDGRSSFVSIMNSDQWMALATETSYYQSKDFLGKCFSLVWNIRKRLDPNSSSNWLERFRDGVSFLKIREKNTFVRCAMKK